MSTNRDTKGQIVIRAQNLIEGVTKHLTGTTPFRESTMKYWKIGRVVHSSPRPN